MARGDAEQAGPGQDIRDYTEEQLFDRRDAHRDQSQLQGEIDNRAQLWHGVIN